jgi:pSer/pThr/pTyr-binding forkhead associated (FHA) protein
MNRIDQFENMAERLVEGTFARLFAGRLSPLKVAAHLERAIEEHQVCIPGEAAQAPTHYWIYLNPRDYDTLTTSGSTGQAGAEAEHALADQITELISQADLALEAAPVVRVEPDEDVSPRDVRVEARWMGPESEEVEKTREMEAAAGLQVEETAAQAPRGRPFLIIEGNRHVNLTQPVVSVGRALDNDVIIEDRRVSRHHAQLRQRYGHYVLYDLDSTGGSTINGYPVEECLLHSGDVISFAGVEVIYGEDPPTPIPLPPDEDTPALTEAEWEA